MNYLFGDSTPSQLTSNFLEFFRDALDFSVFVLQADQRINEGKTRVVALREDAAIETARLERFITAVSGAVDEAEKSSEGKPESPTVECATHLRGLIANAQHASIEMIEQRLAAAIAQIDAEEAATRSACVAALATMLVPHDPPEASNVISVVLGGAGAYEGVLEGRAHFGLAWSFELAIADGAIWNAPVRVERVMPQLEIRAPQLSGWISKEVKTRPQKLERHLVTELVDDGTKVKVKLRAEFGAETGFDLEVDDGRVTGTRTGASDDASVGPFDIDAEDALKITEFVYKLREAAAKLERKRLVSATVDDTEFRAQSNFVEFIERFVAMMKPIVREISERSLTPHELVIRRLLSDDCREEIFVSKATLREKYASLDAPLRAVFAPLGLDGTPPQTSPRLPAASPPPVKDVPSIRAELPRSQPPPPLTPPSRPPPSQLPPLPFPVAPSKSRMSTSNIATLPLARLPTPAPVDAAPAELTPDDIVPDEPDGSDVPNAPDSAPDSAPGSTRDAVAEARMPSEALVGALKKIALLSRNGRTDEAYREYATLFSSQVFADFRPDEQRQALRSMVLAKTPSAVTEAVLEAHRAALKPTQALVKAHEDPADYELLGVTHAVLKDSKAAGEAFSTALTLERARNPQSELCGNLMKRVASL